MDHVTKFEIRIAAVVGSLRSNSVNAAVLRAAVANAPAGILIEPFDLADVPLYSGDIEDRGESDAVAGLQQAVATADGLLIVTPEYNRSVPAVTKNAVDWLSRPHRGGPLVDKPVGIIAATPGGHDAAGVREHLGVAVAANTQLLFPESLGIARIGDKLNEKRMLTDSDAVDKLVGWLDRFGAFVTDANNRIAAAWTIRHGMVPTTGRSA